MQKKSYSQINGEVINTNVELEETLQRINELEELDLVQEYIRSLNDFEVLQQRKRRQLRELEEAKMTECCHMFVIGNRTKEDRLPQDQVVLKCLKCGVTSGIKYASEDGVSIDKMRRIINQTAHHGRLVSDIEVIDMDDIQKRYDSVKDVMSEPEIAEVIKESIRCQKTGKELNKK